MKKTIVGIALALAITGQAQASNNKHSVTLNFGQIENIELNNGVTENVYGISYFQTKGKNELGLALTFDILKKEYESTIMSGIDFDTNLLVQSIGLTYGITDNVYISPSIGFTYQNQEYSNGSNSISADGWGYNTGLDLLYKFDNDFVFGIGAKYIKTEDTDFVHSGEFLIYQAKAGYTF